jgi:hypothetical protein
VIELVRQGDIFAEPYDVLVVPVNTKGVMGKGLALTFLQRHPRTARSYIDFAREKKLGPGGLYAVESDEVVYLFAATKDDWRSPSRLEWIESNLYFIRDYMDNFPLIFDHPPLVVAIPALGAGLGGLSFFKDVLPLMVKSLSSCADPRNTYRIFYPNAAQG